MPPLPTVLGSEIAGELDGSRVMGFAHADGGGYAERAVVDRRAAAASAESATFAEGAAFPMASSPPGFRSPSSSHRVRRPRARDGRGGAVGTAAVQIVRALNGHPVAAVGSAEKLELRALSAQSKP